MESEYKLSLIATVTPKARNEGIFTYLKEKYDFHPILNSSEPLTNLSLLIDYKNEYDENYTKSPNPVQLPLTIDIDLNKYFVSVSHYLLQGKRDVRGMKSWSILGRNSENDEWMIIDYKDDYNYCEIKNKDVCTTETINKIKAENHIIPCRYIQFRMNSDYFDNNDHFRLKNFDIYGDIFCYISSSCNSEVYINRLLYLFSITLTPR